MNLEYLLIFQKSGIPIYSRCYGHFCNKLMKNDVLFSGFLSALAGYSSIVDTSDFDALDIEGQVIKVRMDPDGSLTAIDIGETRLMFYLESTRDYYYVAGFPVKHMDDLDNKVNIDELFSKLRDILETDYKVINWSKLYGEAFDAFEQDILTKAIYPWMKENKSPHSCIMGESCPMRVALTGDYNEKPTIWEAMNNAFAAYKEMSIFTLMRKMFGGIRHKIRSRKAVATA